MVTRTERELREKFIQVAVMAAIREPLTYRVPPSLEIRPGQRVLAPLGSRQATGVALEPAAGIPPGIKARAILRVLDPAPVLSPELLTLGLWISEYYLVPPGEVFRAMLPLGSESRRMRRLRITEAGERQLVDLQTSLLAETRAGGDWRLLDYLAEHPGASFETVQRKLAGSSPDPVAAALRKGWVAVDEMERERRRVLAVELGNSAGDAEYGQTNRLSPVARRIMEALKEQQGFIRDHRELLKTAHATLASLRKLQRDGILNLSDARVVPSQIEADAATQSLMASLAGPLDLTVGQSSALEALGGAMERADFSPYLLRGITGSGKTEIYLRLIARCLEQGRSALLLVPEIALTPMMQAEFIKRFGSQAAMLHSGLSNARRQEEWWRIWRGEAKSVLGTRSAVFAPLQKLGLVVVDEEHDASYKQEETPRYHGRDVAVVRAKLAKALLVLGSATPSLESYWNASQGKYQLLTLEQRVAQRPLAEVEIVDMRQEFRETHTQALISRRLHSELEAQLASGGQVMILLNHRGYAWFLLCRSCGEVERCVNCSISLTYHRREHRLICHYCGYAAPLPSRCAACGGEYLHYAGEGTEKIEDKLRELFPEARVERLDRDVARRPGHYLRVLSEFRDRRINILVGTQMISKGHDFPGVTLVGVISADMGLQLPDFRSAERTFQLLTQVAGRAGRGAAPGRVLVQTFYPEHYAIRLARDQNYPGFFNKEMSFRRVMHYPPAAFLANIVARDVKLERAAEIAALLENFLRRAAGEHTLRILGPHPAPLARVKGRYRIQILLKANSRPHLHRVLRGLSAECDRDRIPPRSVTIDVDPVSIM
jgi:primosomal protein N' (replication factor Y) (superfamily II helicase)